MAALSRRAVAPQARLQPISIDLLDWPQCDAVLAALQDVSHAFYAAYAPRPGSPMRSRCRSGRCAT